MRRAILQPRNEERTNNRIFINLYDEIGPYFREGEHGSSIN